MKNGSSKRLAALILLVPLAGCTTQPFHPEAVSPEASLAGAGAPVTGAGRATGRSAAGAAT